MMELKVKPSLEEFKKLAQKANLVALSTEVSMDLDTPVSVYYKLVGEKRALFWNLLTPAIRTWGAILLLVRSRLSACRYLKTNSCLRKMI